MLPIIYMLWSIECFDFNVLLFKEFCFIEFIEYFKLLVSQKKNVCVRMCAWVRACMRACVHSCVCVYIIVKYSLYLSGF